MRKDDKGLSIINLVLIIMILICTGFISLILADENKESSINVPNEANIVEVRNTIKKGNKTENSNHNVEFLSNIIENGNNRNDTTNEAKKYYYRQLNNTGKAIYTTISNNVNALKNGYQQIKFDINTEGVGDEFQSAWDALTLDRPDLFWVDTKKIILTTRTTTFLSSVSYEYILEPRQGDNYFLDSFMNSGDVENSISQVEDKINEIVNKCTGTTYDKVKKVHDELVELIIYDQTGRTNNSNIYGALIEKTCICEGYAESFKVILDKLNIPCILVYGDGIDSNGNTEAHAWNAVKMDNGNWYAVDVTWDDPIIIGTGPTWGIDHYKNFLKGSNDFERSHRADGDVSGEGQIFTYPTLSVSDYS